jgi:ketosteroid isomerase-like protein
MQGPARTLVVAALGAALWLATAAGVARAAPPTIGDADREAIRRVVAEQLSAFKRNDGAAAFAHAAPSIRALFGTPESFMHMVAQSYAPIHRPRSWSFGELEIVAGEYTQHVTVVGADGTAATAFYLMARQDDGSWKILGCILVPAHKTPV